MSSWATVRPESITPTSTPAEPFSVSHASGASMSASTMPPATLGTGGPVRGGRSEFSSGTFCPVLSRPQRAFGEETKNSSSGTSAE